MVIYMDIIKEIIQRVSDVLDVIEVEINTDYIEFIFIFGFCYSVDINRILDKHDLYNWHIRYIVDEIIDNIERDFLEKTIRKKEN